MLGDWDHPYLTLDPTLRGGDRARAGEVRARRLLYRGKKPVTGARVDSTALAEAEIEYEDNTLAVGLRAVPAASTRQAARGKPAALVIWTTTPWTLPANLAIVAHPSFDVRRDPAPKAMASS